MDANFAPAVNKIFKDVSIHAPVMDANTYQYDRRTHQLVSIHAPVMDAKIRIDS